MDFKKENVYGAHNVTAAAEAAVQRGGTLYVKSHTTHLMENITPATDTLAIMMPGDEVIWHGPHETDHRFHKVSFTVKNKSIIHNPPVGVTVTGYVFGANLSVRRPDMEIRSKKPMAPISSEAFFSTGGIKA